MQRAVLNTIVHVAYPDGPEWELTPMVTVAPDRAVASDGHNLWMYKCALRRPGAFLFFLAKDYLTPPQHVVSAETLLRTIYPQIYRKQFLEVHIDDVVELTEGWWQARYRFVHANAGDIVKLERVKCVREHVLLASAEGNPDDMATYAAEVRMWMEKAQFAPLLD